MALTIDQVWLRYRSRLKSFIRSQIPDTDEADDLLQEILLKTYIHLHSIRDESKIQPWLFQVARNTITDFYRHRPNPTHELLDDNMALHVETEEAWAKVLVECVEPFIASLQTEHAELLTAIDLSNEKQKAYADAHGLPYSTLKSRVSAARKALRKRFEQCCDLTLNHQGIPVDYTPKSKCC